MNRAVNLVPIPMFSPEIVYEVWRCPTDLKNIGLFTRALAGSDLGCVEVR